MHVVPVIDLKAGQVVRAVAGQRSEYRPIESRLVASSKPAAVGRAFLEELGLSHVYVADLDAIEGAEPAWECYETLVESGLSLSIDAGIADGARAEQMVAFADAHRPETGIIGALESLPDLPTLEACVARIGRERYRFSLDLRAGCPITRVAGWKGASAEAIADTVIAMGVLHLVVLDVACVGRRDGPSTERLCRTLLDRHPGVQITTGGGVRGPADLARLADAGCAAALVSSALHDGSLTRQQLAVSRRR